MQEDDFATIDPWHLGLRASSGLGSLSLGPKKQSCSKLGPCIFYMHGRPFGANYRGLLVNAKESRRRAFIADMGIGEAE